MGIVVKLLTIGLFAILLYFVIDFVVEEVQNKLSLDLGINANYILCRMGVFQALNVFFSLMIASWFTNKMLNYLN